MRSISTKLILAFLGIGVISVAIIFITARLNTRAEFIRFLSDQSRTDLISQLSDYHHHAGSWHGVEIVFASIPTPQTNSGPGNQMRPFTLATKTETPFIQLVIAISQAEKFPITIWNTAYRSLKVDESLVFTSRLPCLLAAIRVKGNLLNAPISPCYMAH